MDCETREYVEALLLATSRTYGIRAGRNEIQQALGDTTQGTALADWAVMHLGAGNLLTADELAMYTALDQSGEVDRLSALHDLADVQYVSEVDMKLAIEELSRSTDAITKQADTLRAQQDALSRLVSKISQNDARRKMFEAAQQRRSDVEKMRITAEVEGLSQGLEYRLADLEQQGRDLDANMYGAIDAVWAQDDRLLSSLQNLGWELDQQSPEEVKNTEKVREGCMRLIKTTVETIRTKMDRVYLNSLTEASQPGQAKPTTEHEVSALQEEVESLYAEILPVAQMSIDQQHLAPALKSLSAKSGQGLARSAVATTYISRCLDHLLDRNDQLKDRVETLRSHQIASAMVLKTARDTLSTSVEPPKVPQKQTIPASPARKNSPMRSRANTVPSHTHRRFSSLQEEPPTETLLQSLAIPMPDCEDEMEQGRTIAEALAERTLKMDDVARSGQESFETAAASHLQDIRRAVQLLRDSVLAESSYQEIKLVDPEVDGMIAILDGEVEQIKQRLGHLQTQKRLTKSKKQTEMIERWAR